MRHTFSESANGVGEIQSPNLEAQRIASLIPQGYLSYLQKIDENIPQLSLINCILTYKNPILCLGAPKLCRPALQVRISGSCQAALFIFPMQYPTVEARKLEHH